MSLRADIRSAFNDIAPPAPHLEALIRVSVSAESRASSQSRGTRGPWMPGLRGTMALVAALLVVLIVASVLVGGRVWHDWSVFTNRPAPAGQIDPVQLAALEARPLHLPSAQLGAQCPVGPTPSASIAASFPYPLLGSVSGDGPAYGIAGANIGQSAWGAYMNVVWVTEPQLTGLVLIRGRDTVNQELPVVYVGEYAAGAVLGTDTVNGKQVVQRAELVIDAGHHPATSFTSRWGIYNVRAGIPSRMSTCHAFQIDGEGFSEVFVSVTGFGRVA